MERSICDRFYAVVRARPDHAAVAGEQEEISYRDLNQLTNYLAQRILEQSGDAPEPVALLFHQGTAFVISVLAVLKAGKFFTPLDARDDRGLRDTLDEAGARLILHDDRNRALATSLLSRSMLVSAPYAGQDSPPAAALDAEALCYVYFTTGSTGRPKGVVDNHRNVLHNAYRYTRTLGITTTDRLSMIQSPSFSGCMSSLFSALLNGATLCPYDLEHGGLARLPAWVRQQRISVYHSVPSIFRSLAVPGGSFPSVRLIRLEGDRATRSSIDVYRDHFGEDCRVVVGLGATECGLVRRFVVDRRNMRAVSDPPLGYACPDVEVTVVDDDGVELPRGEIGEICARSRFLALGYWRQPALTRTAFEEDGGHTGLRRYRTGDLGRMDPDGCLHYVSRKSHRLRIHGRTVDPARIEAALVASGLVDACVVAQHIDEAGEPRLAAYYVANSGSPTEPLAFAKAVAGILEPGLIPRYYVPVTELPVSPDGKVSRRALRPPDPAHRVRVPPGTEPATELQRNIARSWQRVLGFDLMDIHQNVFELGVDSLATAQFLLAFSERSGIELAAETVFDNPTIACLARFVEGTPSDDEARSVDKRHRRLALQAEMRTRRQSRG